ncbi:MAG: sugar phosphate isomerase/epimerase [Ruminococcaceae bacterium]|nr:sugar phosphate isomerase/epimerase [Oscillospiraceae bacterium]
MKLPIGIQLYSVRDFCDTDLESTLKSVKEMGYEGVELAGFYGRTPEEFADLLNKYGLKAMSAHVSYYEMRDDMAKVIENCKTVGCEYIAVPWLDPDYRIDGIYGKEMVDNICKFSKMAKEAGLGLLYHNHEFEFQKIGDEYMFDILYAQVPDLLAEQDSCWVHYGGVDPAEYLKKYSNRTPVLHLKDYVGRKDQGNFELRPNGCGIVDIKALVDIAPENGVKWLVVEQDHPSMGMNSLECAQKSIEYLKQIV